MLPAVRIAAQIASRVRAKRRSWASSGRVVQHLGAGQVQQPQLGRHHTAQHQQRQRVELHLEQCPRLGDRPGRAAGLVVDHPDRGAVRPRAVDPIDVPAQQQPRLQLDLDEQLPGLRFEQARVLEDEVGVEQPLGARQPGLGPRSGTGRDSTSRRRTTRPRARVGVHNRSHVGRRSARAASGVRSCAGSRNSCSSTACTSVPRTWAAVGTSGNRSIARNRYSSGHCLKSFARDGDSAGRRGTSPGSPGEAEPLRPGGALRLRHAGHGRGGVRQFR